MRFLSLYFTIVLIVFVTLTHAGDDGEDGEEVGEGDCMSLDCDAKEYKPVCGGLDAESSWGFWNECALRIYNCQHQTEFVVQTEVECEVAEASNTGK